MSIPSSCSCCGGPLTVATDGVCPRCELAAALEPPPPFALPPGAAPESALKHFGDYQLLEELGHGGMGVVYKARHTRLNRIVALKLLLLGQFSNAAAIRRFQREAQAAAALRHPNIVALHDIGEVGGQPYFTMEFVEGRSLAARLREGPLPARRAAEYGRAIADAMSAAHAAGIIHRDLKPSNIILDPFDQPRVTDFGLAKRVVGTRSTASHSISEKITDAVERVPTDDLTLTGQILGSPNYLAPELAAGRVHELSPASDLFSIGAMLNECLTGRPPFVAATLQETLFLLRDADPVPPRVLNPRLPRDLETICLKCLEKEPAKRYASARELAEELNRFLKDEPIHARPVGRVEKAWRWCRRKPALAGLWAATFLLLVAAFTGIALVGLRNAAVRKAEQREYFAGITLADNYVRIGDIQRALDVLTNCPPRFRHWEWGRLMYLCHQEIATIHTVTNLKMAIVGGIDYTRLIVNADQTRLVTVGEDGAATVWELMTGAKLFSAGGSTNRIIDMAFDPAGRRLALLGNAGLVEIWDANEPRRLLGFATSNGPVRSVTFSGDGTRVRVTTSDSASAWDSQTGQFLANAAPALQPDRGSPDPQRVELANDLGKVPTRLTSQRAAAPESRAPGKFQRLAIDPTGTRLATVDARRKVQFWDAENSQLRHTLDGRFSDEARLIFGPDGKRLLVADPSAAPSTVWNTDTGQELASLLTRVDSAAFNTDGSRVATVSGDNVARVWSANSGREILSLKGHAAIVRFIAFSPDAERITTASEDGAVKLWRASLGREHFSSPSVIEGLAFSPDGKRLAVGQDDHLATVWDVESGRKVLNLEGHLHRVNKVAFSADSKRIVTSSFDKTARVWDAETGRLELTLRGHSNLLYGVAISPDGRYVASCGDGVRMWDIVTGGPPRLLQGDTNVYFMALAFRPGGNQLATSFGYGTIILWNHMTGERLRTLPDHTERVLSVAYSSDGRTLATAGFDKMIHLLSPDTGRKLRTLRGHLKFYAVNFSPDGQRLITATAEHMANFGRATAQVRDVETGRELIILDGHTASLADATFSPDGRRVATCDWAGVTRIWETFPWREQDYPGAIDRPMAERAALYARGYWKDRLAADAWNSRSGANLPQHARIDRSENLADFRRRERAEFRHGSVGAVARWPLP